ncbi:MAG: MBL fold metallo-hydrolase [Firmicutes bacterium]|nr:MBL fold metallo-hydrolase [Bacillota bacterium]
MFEQIHSQPDIYKIYIPLPKNPLKNLNCYVLKTPEKNLIVDTGFNMPECREALIEGLKELDLDPEKTELFITHLHSDHCGVVTPLVERGVKVYMGREDYKYVLAYLEGDEWEKSDARYCCEGFTKEQMEAFERKNPAKNFSNHVAFPATCLDDGDKFKIGDYEMTVVFTPGHTPGHCCLYMEREKIMFLGDHVLYDITPNITMWLMTEDSLGNYIQSLKKIREFDIKLALPAHRMNDLDFYERVDALLQHHRDRIMDSYDIVRDNPGFSAMQIAGKMKWDIVCNSWEEFPLVQKWFAVGEALAHVDYLIKRGFIRAESDASGRNTYFVIKEIEEALF